MHKTLTFLTITATVCNAFAQFKVLQNTLDPGNFGDSAGAILQDPGGAKGIPNVLEAFSLCIRFRLKVLGSRGYGERAMLVNIGDM